METKKFKSFKYVVGNDFIYENKIKVKVFFIYGYKNAIRTIDVKKKKDANDSYYVDEAKKVISEEISNGKLAKYAKKYSSPASKRLKFALAAVLSATVIGTGSFYTWKHLDTIHQQEAMIAHTVELIKNLNPNSSEVEINKAIEAYEALPENLKNSVPEETKQYLERQIELLKVDKKEAKEVDEVTITLSIPRTTEAELAVVEDKVSKLTPRAHSMLREGTDELIQDVKAAIEVDKKIGSDISAEALALPISASWDEIYKVFVDVISLSTRAYSYVTAEAKDYMREFLNLMEYETQVVATMVKMASDYCSTDPYTMCTIDDINTLKYVYTDLLLDRTQKAADSAGFTTLINEATKMWDDDSNAAKTLADLAAALKPESCLDKDINAVKEKYIELATNPRIKKLADDSGYSENLKMAEAALQADKDATKKFYNETVGPILNENCSQADIDGVKAKYDAYYKTATNRLKILISSIDYPETNLDAKIKEAQENYNYDFTLAKNLYNECAPKLTSDCTLEVINEVQKNFDDFKNDSTIRDRAKSFMGPGTQYDLQAKIDEARALYQKDVEMANQFNQAVESLPNQYANLSTEQKMIMASAKEYVSKEPDAKHLYLSKRGKTLVNLDYKEKLDTLISGAGDKFKLTLEPTLNDDDYFFFTSDNIVKFDSAVGLYVEITYTKMDSDYVNPRFTKVMGSGSDSDYPRVFNPDMYNHVISRVYAPKGVNTNLKIEGICYIGGTTKYESIVSKTPNYNDFLTIDITIDQKYHYLKGKYNGYTLGIKKQKNSDIGKVFKVTGHYSEMR